MHNLITQYIIDNDTDILNITETWLSVSDFDIINDITFNEKVYTCYIFDSVTSTFGGGVAILVKNNIKVSHKPILLTNCQALFMCMQIHSLSLLNTLLVYRL